MEALCVMMGGAAGALLRWGLVRMLNAPAPWSVFGVNLAGSFLIGLVLGWQARHGMATATFALLATGFLGAFTTFSAFSADNLRLLQGGQHALLAFNVMGQVVVGLLAVGLGRSVLV